MNKTKLNNNRKFSNGTWYLREQRITIAKHNLFDWTRETKKNTIFPFVSLWKIRSCVNLYKKRNDDKYEKPTSSHKQRKTPSISKFEWIQERQTTSNATSIANKLSESFTYKTDMWLSCILLANMLDRRFGDLSAS